MTYQPIIRDRVIVQASSTETSQTRSLLTFRPTAGGRAYGAVRLAVKPTDAFLTGAVKTANALQPGWTIGLALVPEHLGTDWQAIVASDSAFVALFTADQVLFQQRPVAVFSAGAAGLTAPLRLVLALNPFGWGAFGTALGQNVPPLKSPGLLLALTGFAEGGVYMGPPPYL